ncbi:MAG: hypothetical protein U0V70_06345 [Terriglobia bacterium]
MGSYFNPRSLFKMVTSKQGRCPPSGHVFGFLCLILAVLVREPVAAREGKEGMPTGNGSEVLNEVRKNAFRFSDNLPDFICHQVTRRYRGPLGGGQWQLQDTVEADVAFHEGQESYSNLSINGRPSTKRIDSIGSVISLGEFGSLLHSLFLAETQAKFWKEGEDQYRGTRALIFGFIVSPDHSAWTLSYQSTYSLKVGYEGAIWVDAGTRNILKISQHTLSLPPRFPILYSETTTEYGERRIEGIEERHFLLPLAAEILIQERPNRVSSRNVIEFRDFKKFSADVKLKVED